MDLTRGRRHNETSRSTNFFGLELRKQEKKRERLRRRNWDPWYAMRDFDKNGNVVSNDWHRAAADSVAPKPRSGIPRGGEKQLAPRKFQARSIPHMTLDEIRRLTKNTFVDHRDTIGKWCGAQVVDTKPDKLRIHYVGWPPKWDRWITYEQDANCEWEFAPFQSMAQTRQVSDFKLNEHVFARPFYKRNGYEWSVCKIVAIDHLQLQVRVDLDRQQPRLFWLHGEDGDEVKSMKEEKMHAGYTPPPGEGGHGFGIQGARYSYREDRRPKRNFPWWIGYMCIAGVLGGSTFVTYSNFSNALGFFLATMIIWSYTRLITASPGVDTPFARSSAPFQTSGPTAPTKHSALVTPAPPAQEHSAEQHRNTSKNGPNLFLVSPSGAPDAQGHAAPSVDHPKEAAQDEFEEYFPPALVPDEENSVRLSEDTTDLNDDEKTLQMTILLNLGASAPIAQNSSSLENSGLHIAPELQDLIRKFTPKKHFNWELWCECSTHHGGYPDDYNTRWLIDPEARSMALIPGTKAGGHYNLYLDEVFGEKKQHSVTLLFDMQSPGLTESRTDIYIKLKKSGCIHKLGVYTPFDSFSVKLDFHFDSDDDERITVACSTSSSLLKFGVEWAVRYDQRGLCYKEQHRHRYKDETLKVALHAFDAGVKWKVRAVEI